MESAKFVLSKPKEPVIEKTFPEERKMLEKSLEYFNFLQEKFKTNNSLTDDIMSAINVLKYEKMKQEDKWKN